MNFLPKRFAVIILLSIAALGVSASSAAAAAAPVLYGTVGGGTADENLYSVDPATGARTLIGDTDHKFTGLGVDPTTGVLYGVTNTRMPDPRSLFTIDRGTGTVTLVGALGLGDPAADIEFGPDGTLYGWSEDTDDLVTINKATGAATVVGPQPTGSSGSGIALGRAGVMYGFLDGNDGDFYNVDTATGATSVAGTLTGSAIGNNESISAAAFACDGETLFAYDIEQNPGPNGNLVTIDETTGVISTVGPALRSSDGLDFACPSEAAFGPDVSVSAESASAVGVPVNWSGSTKAPTQVGYQTVNGTAAAGTGFTAQSGTLTHDAYTPTEVDTVTVPITQDPTVGSTRTFQVTLSAPSPAGLTSIEDDTVNVEVTPYAPQVKVKKAKPKGNKKKKQKAKKRPSFTFSSNQTGTTSKCRIVGVSDAKTCTSPFKSPKLKQSKKKKKAYTFEVVSTNAGGVSSTDQLEFKVPKKKKAKK